jgi:hypothetical protein
MEAPTVSWRRWVEGGRTGPWTAGAARWPPAAGPPAAGPPAGEVSGLGPAATGAGLPVCLLRIFGRIQNSLRSRWGLAPCNQSIASRFGSAEPGLHLDEARRDGGGRPAAALAPGPARHRRRRRRRAPPAARHLPPRGSRGTQGVGRGGWAMDAHGPGRLLCRPLDGCFGLICNAQRRVSARPSMRPVPRARKMRPQPETSHAAAFPAQPNSETRKSPAHLTRLRASKDVALTEAGLRGPRGGRHGCC